MGLSNDLIASLVKATSGQKQKTTESTVFGKTINYGGTIYVQIDGSELLTPVSATTEVGPNDRVTVLIKDHTATITGNLSSPSAKLETVEEVDGKVDDVDNRLEQVKTIVDENGNSIYAVNNKITLIDNNITAIDNNITAINNSIGAINNQINAANNEIWEHDNAIGTINNQINSVNNEIWEHDNAIGLINNQINAVNNEIWEHDNAIGLINNQINAVNNTIDIINSSFKIENDVITGIKGIDTEWITTGQLEANAADIKTLKTEKLSATEAEIKYANINFTNIGKAAMEYFYAQSGLIKNVVVGDQTITGELIGVTIKGDLIEGNTIVADKLVIKGDDGLYYKLNTDGMKIEAEQTDYNSLNGQVIRAKSVTAEKIAVEDLVAFGATIGGFQIGTSSIYSGVKESVGNSTRGIYMDNQGQIAFGDSQNFIKYYKDQNGNYRLEVSAESIVFGSSGTNVESAISNAQAALEAASSAETLANSSNDAILNWCYNNNKVYINGSKIYAGTVTATQIAANAVTASKISVSTLSAINSDLGSITAGSIDIGNGKFVVSSTGYMTATGATITGDITATSINVKDSIYMYSTSAWGTSTKYRIIYATNTSGQASDLTFGNGSMYLYLNGPTTISGSYAQLNVNGDVYGAHFYGSDFTCNKSTAYYSQFTNMGIHINTVNNSGSYWNQAQLRIYGNSGSQGIGLIGYLNGTQKCFWHELADANGNTKFANDLKVGKDLTPVANNNSSLGSSAYKWKAVYAVSGTISTSDERDKEIIGEIDERYKKLYMNMSPIMYRWKDASNDKKVHLGLGAQSTEKEAGFCGITEDELGFVNHEYWDKADDDGRSDGYGMNYQEISVLTVPIVQEHERRLDSIDPKIENLQTLLMQALDKIAAQEKLIEQLQVS